MFAPIVIRQIVNRFLNILAISMMLTVSFNASAGPVSQESETLAAQVNVTRDQISQLVSKLKSTQTGGASGFSHPDFVAKSRELNAMVEQAMVEYEATLANEVLRPAALWIDRLNAIQASTAYSPEQRKALFQDQWTQAHSAFQVISKTYQTAIIKVYMLVLPTVELKGGTTLDYTVAGHARVYANLVRKNCMSSACIALFSSQLTSFVSLVSSTLNKPIVFKTGDGKLQLEPTRFDKDDAIKHFGILPNQGENLPFDIQPADYRKALVEQTAIAYSKSEASKTCQGEGDRMKALACASESGCLQGAEAAYVETAIENGSWSGRSEKIACFRR